MLQNPRKTLGFKKNMIYKIPPGGRKTISSQWPNPDKSKIMIFTKMAKSKIVIDVLLARLI